VAGRRTPLAYYKLQLDLWCDSDPEESDLEEIAQNISARDARSHGAFDVEGLYDRLNFRPTLH